MKYIKINSDTLDEHRDALNNQLSSSIESKKFYLKLSNYYSKCIDLLNIDLNGYDILITDLLLEIQSLEEKIDLLELSEFKDGCDYNSILNHYNDIDFIEFNDYRLGNENIVYLVNVLFEHKDKLVKKYEALINEKRKVIKDIKTNKKEYRTCIKNVSRCDYNIKSITKALNNTDNIYFISNDKISKKYITPKVKKLTRVC